MSPWAGVALAGLFIVLNGFFVAAEFALVKVRDSQLVPLARKGHKGAVITRSVIARLDRYLNASQLGITLCSLALGWVGEPALVAQLTPVLALLELPERAVHSIAFVLAFGFLSMCHILFGELVPKFVGLRRTVPTALFAARPLLIFRTIFKPFLWVMDVLSELVLRLLGLPPAKHAEGALSEEEIRYMLDSESAKEQLHERKRELMVKVLRSAERPVRLAMVPRVDMAHLDLADSIEVAVAKTREHEFSRLPVVRNGDLDDIAGYIHLRDLMHGGNDGPASIADILRDPLYVPETVEVAKLLERMRAARVHMAIVVDDYGGTSGLVTLEDLLEEIVGEIQDEFDVETEAIVEQDDGSLLVDGHVPLTDVLAALDLSVPEETDESVSAFLIERLGRIPRQGDRVVHEGASYEVGRVQRRRIAQVRVRRQEDVDGGSPATT
ncbi:MAG: HlyC/CorC family transporter [Myxococcales bacterium]|nr:HlyC/CorC family transporter [Myxococcales bacterium]